MLAERTLRNLQSQRDQRGSWRSEHTAASPRAVDERGHGTRGRFRAQPHGERHRNEPVVTDLLENGTSAASAVFLVDWRPVKASIGKAAFADSRNHYGTVLDGRAQLAFRDGARAAVRDQELPINHAGARVSRRALERRPNSRLPTMSSPERHSYHRVAAELPPYKNRHRRCRRTHRKKGRALAPRPDVSEAPIAASRSTSHTRVHGCPGPAVQLDALHECSMKEYVSRTGARGARDHYAGSRLTLWPASV